MLFLEGNELFSKTMDLFKCSKQASIFIAVATTEADEAIASSVFVQIMVYPLKKLLVEVILIIFGHFGLV